MKVLFDNMKRNNIRKARDVLKLMKEKEERTLSSYREMLAQSFEKNVAFSRLFFYTKWMHRLFGSTAPLLANPYACWFSLIGEQIDHRQSEVLVKSIRDHYSCAFSVMSELSLDCSYAPPHIKEDLEYHSTAFIRFVFSDDFRLTAVKLEGIEFVDKHGNPHIYDPREVGVQLKRHFEFLDPDFDAIDPSLMFEESFSMRSKGHYYMLRVLSLEDPGFSLTLCTSMPADRFPDPDKVI